MMDGTGIELYVHLEKLEEEVEQFNNVSKNFGDYIDMYKRQMDVMLYDTAKWQMGYMTCQHL